MRILRWILVVFTGLILFAAVNQYLFCPQYSFPRHHPFAGTSIFNPYEHADSVNWKQCNFHAHVHAWGGLTHGSGTAAECWNVYDSLGYDVHCISDYEKVNRYGEGEPNFIPAYEHGYGMLKNHHGVIGTFRVNYGDYIFPQTLSNKQHMLDCLQENDSAVIAINHPVLRNGVSPDDFLRLHGYDAIEVLRSGTHSFPQWDSALSSGHAAYIIADDDMHDSSRPNEVGKNCTWIHAQSATRNEILTGLKSGNAYGMIIASPNGETMQQKFQRFRSGFPKLNSLRITGDTLKISLSATAHAIRFIGQGGQEKFMAQQTATSAYYFQPADTYIRIQADFDDGTSIFLNPVFRFDESVQQPLPFINQTRTALFRIAGAVVLLIFAVAAFRLLRKTSL